MQQRALSQAFWDWLDGVDAQKAEAADRQRAERALKLMTNRSLHMAFGRWVEYAEQCAAQRALLDRAAARMLNVKLAAALVGWEEATAQQRVVVQRALARLSQREVAGAFARWQEQVAAAQATARAVAKAEKFFLALKNHAAHAAFSGWSEAARALAAQ